MYFKKGHYGLSVSFLKKSLHYKPHDFRIHKQLGKAYHELGKIMPSPESVLSYVTKAQDHFYQAAKLNPNDAEAVYLLAKENAWLEDLYPLCNPLKRTTSFDPLPYFKKAIQLRPNGILYHYALARYLFHIKHLEELYNVVKRLVQIYPYSYHYLRKEPFWSDQVREAVYEGLHKVIKRGESLRSAHMILSSLKAEEGKWADALFHYQEALKHQTYQNRVENDLTLGRLYLKNDRFIEAEESYIKGFYQNHLKLNLLERFYNDYKKEGHLDELYSFYERINREFYLSPHIEILCARVMIDLNRLDEAKQILNDLNEKRPEARAYYWLARIYERIGDWDGMELAIQKATVLDPDNKYYHQIFSQVLRRMGKVKRANKEAERARGG